VAEVAASVKGLAARSRRPVHSLEDLPMRSFTNLCARRRHDGKPRDGAPMTANAGRRQAEGSTPLPSAPRKTDRSGSRLPSKDVWPAP